MNKKSMFHLRFQGDRNTTARESQMQGNSFVLPENSPFLRSTVSNRKWWTEKDMRAKERRDKIEVDPIIENGYVQVSIQTFSGLVSKGLKLSRGSKFSTSPQKILTSKRTKPKVLVISDENPLKHSALWTNDRNIMIINMLFLSLRWINGKSSPSFFTHPWKIIDLNSTKHTTEYVSGKMRNLDGNLWINKRKIFYRFLLRFFHPDMGVGSEQEKREIVILITSTCIDSFWIVTLMRWFSSSLVYY